MTEQTEGAETFRGYIDAEAAATRSFIAYKFGEVSEAEVHRLQRIAHAAQERHLAALAAAEVRGAQAVLAAVEEELDDADQLRDTLEKPNYITVWGVRRVLVRFGGKPHRFPVPAERCGECDHLSWNHYTTEQSLDGCAECSCLLSRREAEWGRDEEMDESIRQALYEDALSEGYDPEPDR